MGMIWRAMPLLSTLAALVIIAHSAEEGFDDDRIRERDYRYELRPRVLETETQSYDQPWRAIETEPIIQDAPEDHQPYDEPIRRRRPVRKRKRRPLPASEETQDDNSQNKVIHNEEAKNESEENTNSDVTEAPRRRRRKRPRTSRPSRFTEEFFDFDVPRPTRRKNRRRQQQSLDNEPRLSEFGTEIHDHTTEAVRDYEYSKVDSVDKENKEAVEIPALEDYEIVEKVDKAKVKSIPIRYFELPTENTEIGNKKSNKPVKDLSEFSFETNEETEYNNPKTIQEVSELRDKLGDKSTIISNVDKSLDKNRTTLFDFLHMLSKSDTTDMLKFAIITTTLKPTLRSKVEKTKSLEKKSQQIDTAEMERNLHEKLDEILRKSRRKVHNIPYDLEYIEVYSNKMADDDLQAELGPIDPAALKEILKKSNGTSLSEILQEHNLSLSDLLHGKEDAISVLRSKTLDNNVANNTNARHNNNLDESSTKTKYEKKTKINTKQVTQISQGQKTESVKKQPETRSVENDTKSFESEERLEAKENGPRLATIRRFPGNIIPGNTRRIKLRLRPSNNTMKNQLSRDLIAQTARKYHNGRTSPKGKEWKQVLPSMNLTHPAEEANIKTEKEIEEEIPIEIETTSQRQETTTMPEDDDDDNDEDEDPTQDVQITTTQSNVEVDTSGEEEPTELEPEHDESAELNTTVVITTTPEITTTEKPKRYKRPMLDEKKIGRIRQAYHNRIKRKGLKHRITTTESPDDDSLKDFIVIGDLVSSSEFVARTQRPDTPLTKNNDEEFTSLDDFLTTPMPKRAENVKTTRISTMAYTTPRRVNYVQSTTEDTAKIEIAEILNDTRTSARLSKILMERNMTLNELVEHRERGSSHVHLADIFHNASKEPNPPEPFLSKSSIEPISKETYPLRALLEANLHDPAAKASTLDPNLAPYIHIPVVMDFGNNVNENGENMGIMSLFNKITPESKESVENSHVKKDSEGTPYISTIISVNATEAKANESFRESKDIKEPDVAGWKKLLDLMRKHHENSTEDDIKSITTDETSSESTKPGIEEPDAEDVIVLEDLQRLDAFKSNIASKSEEKLDENMFESHTTIQPGILDRLPSSTRSVTVATASIVGLAMILFLLTYAAFKWKQQRSLLRKKESFSEDRIPTPVFESRKSLKNNCSTRSISPMLASNIYTMNTLDSRAGTESPEYMWDSLRKPFQ